MTTVGTIIDDGMVEDAVIATLQAWISFYLAEVEEQRGLARGAYDRPRSYMVRNDLTKWPEESLPAIVVISPGLSDRAVKEGRGLYRVPWQIGIAAVVSAKDHASTRRMAYRYAAAIRALLVQHQSLDGALGGVVRGVTWLDGRNNEMPAHDDRTVFASRQIFTVEVAEALQQNVGPLGVPPVDPLAPLDADPVVPDIDHIQVTKTKEPING